MNSRSDSPSLEIVRLTSTDAAIFRELRLEGLRDHPEAFGADWEDEAAQSESQFATRLHDAIVFGVRSRQTMCLDGIIGVYRPTAIKTKHKATIWGMYFRPCARRAGLGSALLMKAIEYAAPSVEEVILTVGSNNDVALNLYKSFGFEQYGLERRALKIGKNYYDEMLMSLPLST